MLIIPYTLFLQKHTIIEKKINDSYKHSKIGIENIINTNKRLLINNKQKKCLRIKIIMKIQQLLIDIK